MPIYEYRCPECQRKFEVLQSVGSDGSDLICPDCGKPKPEKVLSVVSIPGMQSGLSERSCAAGGFT